jgi:hypothetical protein
MIHEEDIFRVRLAVDNTQRRQIPMPTPWYERWHWLIFLALLSLGASWFVSVVALALER